MSELSQGYQPTSSRLEDSSSSGDEDTDMHESEQYQQYGNQTQSRQDDLKQIDIGELEQPRGSAAPAQQQEDDNELEWREETEEHSETQQQQDGNMKVVASHYNELKEAGRKERFKSRIFHMRNFNNWIKSQLISEYLKRIHENQRMGEPMRVLDMCCGKGGDLLKWEKAMITYLICTDIAEVSVEQCKKRYEDICRRAEKSKFPHKFEAEFFACDSTLVRLRERFKDPSLKLNLVSCQFAFHYSFESLTQAECMVRNAAECLQPGGFFIATMPDAYELMKRLRASSDGRSFGNEVYNIEFVCDTNPPPLFGAKYQFHLEGVVDCPEFLVHFPTLVKLCRKYGLKLDRKTTFADYYKENIEKGRGLLQRMNCLDTVYANRVGNDEQYAHLKRYMKSNSGRPYGSLTKCEWEAATIYLVCAFRKCKNTWDAQGKPVFEFDD
ncbi:mRNA cap guanine-N7 methyltransferase [Lucilia sericata]|uniref:mRNA cap guanine-N7 methyltransferase n=1 Tax=Lucilia sericata TaxID=13632 RepID=UPI0018A7F662|nr:mRNA cap guanine-N7 methyltransferase [Lucilia sericata]